MHTTAQWRPPLLLSSLTLNPPSAGVPGRKRRAGGVGVGGITPLPNTTRGRSEVGKAANESSR